ncbi:heat-inducible transcriptional repressor HrcA [Salsuginibacillus kocurii]|uniref:heat-inducible transcriptional repressor HrcA n=1 Tax=Salsuginibacillus kocurii TaxID=427078 RepID=UPI00037809BE|nr:heat-inducible transcriptional repressor HrcA [Salsuginibacillus kocurii]
MLSERQLFILRAIIDDYTQTAEAVGSRSISKRSDVNYSPATIRNEMADLEELGFLEKPHSSSGRIPSQKGYRYYVDHLLSPHHLSRSDLVDLRTLFAQKVSETEEVIKKSAHVLSELTSYISVALGPEAFEAKLKHMQIVPLNKESAVAIMVTDTGQVENRPLTLPSEMDMSELEKIVNILNERLQGVPLYKLHTRLYTEVFNVLEKHVNNYRSFLDSFEQAVRSERPEKVYYGGKTNLLSQPEFKDVEKVRLLLELLEEDDKVHRMLSTGENGVTVRIGNENDVAAFEDLSLITATYSIAGKPVGTVGILGPTRMEYPRVIGLLEHMSKDLTNALTDLYYKK